MVSDVLLKYHDEFVQIKLASRPVGTGAAQCSCVLGYHIGHGDDEFHLPILLRQSLSRHLRVRVPSTLYNVMGVHTICSTGHSESVCSNVISLMLYHLREESWALNN